MRRGRRWRGGTSFLGLLASAIGGCGQTASNPGDASSDGGGSFAGGPIALEDFIAELSKAECERVSGCCAELGLPVAKADCSTRLEAIHLDEYVRDDPDYTYDPHLAGACLAAAPQYYAQVGCEFAVAPWGIDATALEVCNSVFQGHLEPGASCRVSVECAEPQGEFAYCTDAALGKDTACFVEHRASEGYPCEASARCSEGLYCESGICVPKMATGEACASYDECQTSRCDDSVCADDVAPALFCKRLSGEP